MWKITQRKVVYLGQKQGRSTHPERNSAGVPPKEEEHGKEAVKSFIWASLVAQMVKNLPVMQETWIWSLGQEDPLERGMATHSSIFAWRIPWTEEPEGLQSMGLQSVFVRLCAESL